MWVMISPAGEGRGEGESFEREAASGSWGGFLGFGEASAKEHV